FAEVEVAVQEQPLGTGDAVRSARARLADFDGDVLVLNGDVPALSAGVIRDLLETHREAGAAATVLSFEPPDPRAYGRIVRAAAAAALRDRINTAHMLAGVTIVDPQTTWIEPTVSLEPDTTIHPFTVLRGATTIAGGAEIHPHVVAIDTQIGPEAVVGPFCYLRPGTVLAARSKAGTFVELKNSHIGEGTKVPHLSYLGDADVGDGTNVAAGNITVNYPHQEGRPKSETKIGANVRTGVQN